MSKVASVDAANFEQEVLGSEQPIVVDFWAPWCPPCRALTPLLEEAAEKYSGQLKIVKCDVDENPELSAGFAVSKIPHLLFFKNGQPVGQAVGYISKQQLTQQIDEVLGS